MRTIFAILVAVCLAGAARADDVAPATPRFGGCVKWAGLCAGPDVAVTLISYDPVRKTLNPEFSPGAGYSFTLASDKWYSFGVGIYGTLRRVENRTDGNFTAQACFAHYLRGGITRAVQSATYDNAGTMLTPAVGRWLPVFGAGFDFR